MQISRAEALAQIKSNLSEARAAVERHELALVGEREDARRQRRAAYDTIKEAVRRRLDLLDVDVDWPAAPKTCDWRLGNLSKSIDFLERQLKSVEVIADEVFVVGKNSVIWRAVAWELPYWAHEKRDCS